MADLTSITSAQTTQIVDETTGFIAGVNSSGQLEVVSSASTAPPSTGSSRYSEQSITAAASLFPRDRRALEQKALALYERGPRAVAEFLIETVAARPEIRGDIHARLRRFNRVPPEVYAALGADKLPPPAVYVVTGP